MTKMSVKTPSERFLMTLPKPIYDQISGEAERLGVSIQERVRIVLEEHKKRLDKPLERPKILKNPELEKRCYEVGKKVYEEYAVERKRLRIIQVEDGIGKMEIDEVILPIIAKTFHPFDRGIKISLYYLGGDEYLSMVNIGKAAKEIAEMENKLLAICEDGEIVYEALPFQCRIWSKNEVWEGSFLVCLNSFKTPTLSDVLRVTS